MKIIDILIFICTVAVFFACNNNEENRLLNKKFDTSEIILLDLNSKNKLEFDTVRLIKLYNFQDNLLGNEIKFKIDKNNIYCLENSNIHSVLKYDLKGNFICKYGNKGGGPDEYPNATDFFVDKDTVVIQSSAGLKTQLYFFDSQGKFLCRKENDILSQTIERLGENYYLYASYIKAYYDYRLFSTNSTFKELKHFLPNNSNLDIPVMEENFQKTDNVLTFIEAFNNCAYLLNENGLVKKYCFDFGKFSIPKEFFKKNSMEGLEMIDKKGFANIRRYFESPSFSTFVITIQKQNSPAIIINLVYNKNDNKILQAKFNEEDQPVFSDLITVTEKNEFVFLIFPHILLNKKSTLKNLSDNNLFFIDNLNETDNPVLAFCKIKQDE